MERSKVEGDQVSCSGGATGGMTRSSVNSDVLGPLQGPGSALHRQRVIRLMSARNVSICFTTRPGQITAEIFSRPAQHGRTRDMQKQTWAIAYFV